MIARHVVNIEDCTRFRQTIEARPPVIVHGAALLGVLTLVAAVGWAACTPANLVVRSAGRVRPVEPPTQVYASRHERLDGRISAVHFKEGDRVRRGDVLVELDTARLDNDISKIEGTIEAVHVEVARLDELRALRRSQYEAACAKADAEIIQAQAELDRERRLAESAVRRAELGLAAADDHCARLEKLLTSRAATEAQWVEASARQRDAREKLSAARLPIDDGRLAVLRQARDLIDREYAVTNADVDSRRDAKRAELELAQKERASLTLARGQSTLRSPIDGVVTKGQLRVGDVLELGKPAVEVAKQQGFYFEAEVSSDDMGLLREGLPSRIKFDAFDYQRYGALNGEIEFIAPDSTPSSSAAAAYLVRIELSGDHVAHGDLRGDIKLGMTGSAEIVTGQQSLLSILLKRIRSSISLG